jgi:cysteine-rich repeat protein
MRYAILLSLLAGCVTPAGAFECSTSDECSGGTCEPDGLCSFADAACPSGRRYGESAGGKAGTCVDGGGSGVCGDGTVTGDEECDDATPFCVECKRAICGDGQVLAGVEDCDDGNTVDGDTCNANCLSCGPGSVTNPANNHCYSVIETAVTWDTAADDCVARGGYLVSINDAAENTFVMGLLVNAHYWTGLQQVGFGSEVFRWQDDDAIGTGDLAAPVFTGFTNWGAGEPTENNNADFCSGILLAGTWDHQTCTVTHPYICEREPPHVDPATNHIYRRFTGVAERPYTTAVTACTALGPNTHLVTITDQMEQDFIHAIAKASRTWIGLDDIAVEGTLAWVTGEPVSFVAWNVADGQPDQTDPDNDAAALLADGTWEMRDLTSQFNNDPYICETDP